MESALGFPLLLNAVWRSGNSGMGERTSGWGGFGEAESIDPCSARRVGQGKPVLGADLSAAVRVKVSTDVQASGLSSGQKAGQCMLWMFFYKSTYSEDMAEVKLIQKCSVTIFSSNNIYSTLWHYTYVTFCFKKQEDLLSALVITWKKYVPSIPWILSMLYQMNAMMRLWCWSVPVSLTSHVFDERRRGTGRVLAGGPGIPQCIHLLIRRR